MEWTFDMNRKRNKMRTFLFKKSLNSRYHFVFFLPCYSKVFHSLFVRNENIHLLSFSSILFFFSCADWLRDFHSKEIILRFLCFCPKNIVFHSIQEGKSCCLHIFMLHSFCLIKYLYLSLETNRRKMRICFTNLFDVYISQIVSQWNCFLCIICICDFVVVFYFSFHSQRVTENWYALYQSQ